MKLWAGQTVSQVGSQVTILALPLAAILILQASAVQLGILGAAQFAPFLLFGLVIGIWVDRLPRRLLLIGSDFGRAVLLIGIPIAWVLGHLTMGYLYVTAFLVGCLTLVFDVSYQSYLPSLVGRGQLVDANSKLEGSRSLGQAIGPGLGGVLVQALTAPVAIVLDSISFCVSGISLLLIRTREEQTSSPVRQSIIDALLEGFRFVVHHPILRPIAIATGVSNLFLNMIVAIYILYQVRNLHLSPAIIGLALTIGSAGGVIAAFAAGKISHVLGIGRTLVLGVSCAAAGALVLGSASFARSFVVPLVVVGMLFFGASIPVYNVTQVSLRQVVTPQSLQGRMNASMRFLVWGTIPLGMLTGGVLGRWVGLRNTILLAGVGVVVFALPWLALTAVGRAQTPEDLQMASGR
jgi:MFS family permease